VQRYFGVGDQSAYDVAVIAENAHGAVMYSSDTEFPADENVTPDAALNLFGRPVPILRATHSASERLAGPQRPPHSEDPSGHSAQSPSEVHDEGPLRIEPIHYHSGESDWEISARHHKGSVEAAVSSSYHRNLAINFGVLLVLATTMGLIIVASQRARRLAQLQMDFVASVSHELRTPLTGIVSAAENISDGVVDSKERLARYGTAIMGQARQLTDLVEQILLFSATQKNRHRYHFRAANIADVIGASIRHSANLIRSSGFIVEQDIEPDLPLVMVDFNALSQCLQNLIDNAMKYGGVSRWIGIRARRAELPYGGKEIRITVEDKGIGIAREDLKKIFKPFYRSPAVTAEQIHGSGLGLALAKTIAEAMGGSLTVQSVPQKGSVFTVHLPIKEDFPPGDHLSSTPQGNSIS
jgi:signal transduction histidine kinase